MSRLSEIPELPIQGIYMAISLRNIALQLCTCTWIEIMTGAGIALYMLYLGNFMLAGVTAAAFVPLILFHFAMTRLPKSNVEWKKSARSNRLVKIR